MAAMEIWEPPEPRRRRETPGSEPEARVWLDGDPDGRAWTRREAARRQAAVRQGAAHPSEARQPATAPQAAAASQTSASQTSASQAGARRAAPRSQRASTPIQPDPDRRPPPRTDPRDPRPPSYLASVTSNPDRRQRPTHRGTPVPAGAAVGEARILDLGAFRNRLRPQAPRVPDGPLAYRHRVRWYGPLLALVPPLCTLALAAYVASTTEATGKGLMVKGATVFILTLCALPTALLAGIPWNGGGGRYVLAVASSILVWLVVGAVAGRLATRSAVASWRDWWREYGLLVAGLWGGVLMALGVVAVALGVLG